MRMRYGWSMLILLAGAAVLASCAVLGLRRDLPAPPAGYAWLKCTAVPEQKAEGPISGGTGGVLNLPGGHSLLVPATAVPAGRQYTFTVRRPASIRVELDIYPLDEQGDTVRVLADSATLTLNYAGRGCTVGGAPLDTSQLFIFRVDSAGLRHQRLPKTEARNFTISTRVLDFSTFAIGGVSATGD